MAKIEAKWPKNLSLELICDSTKEYFTSKTTGCSSLSLVLSRNINFCLYVPVCELKWPFGYLKPFDIYQNLHNCSFEQLDDQLLKWCVTINNERLSVLFISPKNVVHSLCTMKYYISTRGVRVKRRMTLDLSTWAISNNSTVTCKIYCNVGLVQTAKTWSAYPRTIFPLFEILALS